MKKKIIMSIGCLMFQAIISSDMERVALNGSGRISSLVINVLERIDSSAELRQAIENNDNWKSVYDSYDITPKALAEQLVLDETGHQLISEQVAYSFTDMLMHHRPDYNLCVSDLLKELYARRDNKQDNPVCLLEDLQQEFRKNIAHKIYQMQGEISQKIPKYERLRNNYRMYVVRTCLFSVVSIMGLIPTFYFGWRLHQCS